MFKNAKEIHDHWTEFATRHLVGHTIESVRMLSESEVDGMGWTSGCLVIQFDDQSIIFASQDDEGNGPGALFGQTPDGNSLTFPVIQPLREDADDTGSPDTV